MTCVEIIDPSDKFRPEKDDQEFRNYTENGVFHDRVKRTYYEMHSKQTMRFVSEKIDKWCKFEKTKMTLMDAIHLLDSLIDESDPDTGLPNSVHAFQTAERIRKIHPDKPWFHLIGLIHDLGKVLALWGEPQWCVVGDTFPVGCAPSDKIVFGKQSFSENPDYSHEILGSKYGIYETHCGLKNLMMSWGHDEYMYRMLVHNNANLSLDALNIIRYHSFYPWHTGRDYKYLSSEEDAVTLKNVLEFNKFDLYSKADDLPNMEEIKPYYQKLMDKYCPGELEW